MKKKLGILWLLLAPAEFAQPPVATLGQPGQALSAAAGSPGHAAGRGRISGRRMGVRSPEILGDHRVTFRLRGPNATTVVLNGDWPWGRGGWSGYLVGQREPARLDFRRYGVSADPNWDFHSFDFDSEAAYADSAMTFLTANDSDLSRFQKRFGKLLLYQGWADPVVPPDDTIRYFEAVQRAMGGAQNTAPFARLFLAPGMGHCSGGPGPNSFDSLAALDDWVTRGAAPDRMVATHATGPSVERARPLCPYPQAARWKGSGSTDDAANFECAAAR